MTNPTKRKVASGVVLVFGLFLIAAPVLVRLEGAGATAAYLTGLAAIGIAAKTMFRPHAVDVWLLVGIGAVTLAAAIASGGSALWILFVCGAAILGAGLWRRMLTEPEGGPHTSPS